MNRIKKLGFILIFAVSFCIYSNTLKNGFVMDDKNIIVGSKLIKKKGISEIFLQPYWRTSYQKPFFGKIMGLYRPLPVLTYALNYRISKLNPFSYHLVNIFLHFFNCLLLYYFALKILKSDALSLLVSLLFATHPIHTEAVAYVSLGRAELLSYFFFFSSLLAYVNIKTFKRFRLKLYIPSLILFFLALLSKENSIALIGVIIIYDFIFASEMNVRFYLRELWSKYIKFYFGYVLVIGIYLSIRYIVLGGLFIPKLSIYFTGNPLINFSFYQRILPTIEILKEYLFLLFYPVDLIINYPYGRVYSSMGILEIGTLNSLLIFLLFLFLIIWSYKRSKEIFFAALFFLVSYSIVSNFIVVIGTIMNERLLYLPSAAFCIFVVTALGGLSERFINKKNSSLVVILLVVPLLCYFSVRTFLRNKDWRDEISLMQADLRVYKNDFFPYVRLGHLYRVKGENDKAMESYGKAVKYLKKSIEVDERNPNLYNSLGMIYMRHELDDKAIFNYNKAIEVDPGFGYAYYNLGSLYFREGLFEESISFLKRTVEIFPHYPEGYNNLGMAYWKVEEYDKAIYDLEKAVELDQEYETAYNNLGMLYSHIKDFEKATVNFEKVVELNPNHSDVLANLGFIFYFVNGDNNKALYYFNKSLELKPNRKDALEIKKVTNKISELRVKQQSEIEDE